MAAFTRADYEDAPPFATLLPHSILLDPEAGVLLLSTPRWGKPTLALGCAWAVEPRNIETCDEAVCLDLARMHESFLRSLPIGSALQVMMSVFPTTAVPAWEARRSALLDLPVVQAQHAALRAGLLHQDGMTQTRLRLVRTLVTLRIPVVPIDTGLAVQMRTLLSLPTRSGAQWTARLATHLATAVEKLERVRLGIEDTLRGAGHTVTRLDGRALGGALHRALAPWEQDTPVIIPDIPLSEQVLSRETGRVPGGFRFGPDTEADPLTAQVLSLHRAPPRTYPGILSAPRAPHGGQPLALWDAHPGPLTIVVNVAAVDQAAEKARLSIKRGLALVQSAYSLQNKTLKRELDRLMRQFFLTGGQILWARVHVVVWGRASAMDRALDHLIRTGRKLDLEFVAEPVLGSTLFLHTLPLGFDPDWPHEHFLRRARRLPVTNIAQLLPLYDGFHGTETATILYANRRGEAVVFDPFDTTTAPHMIVIGGSGSGKSFAMIHLAQHILPLGGQLIIMDQLPSYQELCGVWGGRYLEMDFNAPMCFNPFTGPRDAEHRAFLMASLREKATGGSEELTRQQLGVLSNAIAFFLEGWDDARGEPRLGYFVPEVLQEGCFAPQDREARRIGKELAHKLGMFYGSGPYAGFVDGPTTLGLDQRLTVFEAAKLSNAHDLLGSLLFDLMYLLQHYFADPLRQLVPKCLISEESWTYFRYANTGDMMARIGRTYRKLYASAIFLSQQASDFSSPAGRVLLANSPVILFLQQEAQEIAALKDVCELTPHEQTLCTLAQKFRGWTQAYLRLPNKRGGMIRIVPDGHTRWVGTQDPQEKVLREAARAEAGGDLGAAVALLATRYPQGLTGGSAGDR